MEWQEDPITKNQIEELIKGLKFDHVDPNRIHCFRTRGSKARAYARIWSFPKIFQQVLNVEPAYVIELISEKYDRLSADFQTKVLIHELLHIPSNFSGSLLPHKYGYKRIDREVERLFNVLKFGWDSPSSVVRTRVIRRKKKKKTTFLAKLRKSIS